VFRNAQFCSDEARIYISHVQIRLIRHAQPSYVTAGILTNDPPLTQLGRRQAQLLAQRDWGRVDEIWVSPMVRARQTAEPIVTDDLHPNLWTEPDDASILYVAHGGTNAVSIGHLLGADPTPWEWDRFDSAHTSVATIRTKPVSRAIAFGMVGFGDTSHLPPDEVTR
jgi:broad specificity phosphatase PhoE